MNGVRGVAFATAGPVSDEGTGSIELTTAEKGRRVMPSIEVSPTYFDVFGIRVERGRAFTAGRRRLRGGGLSRDSLARSGARMVGTAPTRSGRRLAIDATHTLDVVGIAGDATSEIAEPVQALMVYTPWRPNARLYQPFLRVEDGRERRGAARGVAGERSIRRRRRRADDRGASSSRS